MLKSMTGYGRCRDTVGGKDITVEIKSVNNRYFDCTVKITRTFSFLEERIKSYVQAAGVLRGKLDISVSVDVPEGGGGEVSLDIEYARGYIDALRKLRDTFDLADDISVMTVAQHRDIFTVKKTQDDTESDWADISSVLERATDAFNESRAVEGNRLICDITHKLGHIEQLVASIAEKSGETTKKYEQRLYKRLRSVLDENSIEVNENRIITECALFADRVAIDEELVRLSSHMKSFGEFLASDEMSGKKLDFYIQEINRETNTIGSKAQNTDTARLVVEIKSELEKIREQIQNLE